MRAVGRYQQRFQARPHQLDRTRDREDHHRPVEPAECWPCDQFQPPPPECERERHRDHAANQRQVRHPPRNRQRVVARLHQLGQDRLRHGLRQRDQRLAKLARHPEPAKQRRAAKRADQQDHRLLACDGETARKVGRHHEAPGIAVPCRDANQAERGEIDPLAPYRGDPHRQRGRDFGSRVGEHEPGDVRHEQPCQHRAARAHDRLHRFGGGRGREREIAPQQPGRGRPDRNERDDAIPEGQPQQRLGDRQP